VLKPVAGPVDLEVRPLDVDRLSPTQWSEFSAFCARAGETQRRILGASERVKEAQGRLDHVRKALLETPGTDASLLGRGRVLHGELKDLQDLLSGDATIAKRQEPALPGLLDRILEVVGSVWNTTQLPTATQRQNLAWAEDGLKAVNLRLDQSHATLKALEDALEVAKAPYTPGRSTR